MMLLVYRVIQNHIMCNFGLSWGYNRWSLTAVPNVCFGTGSSGTLRTEIRAQFFRRLTNSHFPNFGDEYWGKRKIKTSFIQRPAYWGACFTYQNLFSLPSGTQFFLWRSKERRKRYHNKNRKREGDKNIIIKDEREWERRGRGSSGVGRY